MGTSLVQDGLQYFKYTYSTLLLIFSVVLVMACIVTGESKAALYNIHPAVAIILFWLLIGWLAVMEGGQGCLVGLKPLDTTMYRETHPISYKCCTIAHRATNLERFIVGRQFLVVLVIFLINMMGEAQPGADPIPGIPETINTIFLGNSLALILTVIDIAQLPAQVTAASSMLDFIQSYIFLGTTYISLAIEFSGLLHTVYLVQYGFEAIAGTNKKNDDDDKTKKKKQKKKKKKNLSSTSNTVDDVDDEYQEQENPNESPDTIMTQLFFWGRVVMSTGILCFAFAVTLTAIIQGNSGMWEGVPAWASIIIFFILLCVVGLMEGMQIAAFALLNMPEEDLLKHKIAHKNCTLMFTGENLQSFLIGRQIFVASLMFIVARIATISIQDGEPNMFNVSDGFQEFLDTGLLGAIILTVVGSLAWRVIASSFPLLFMSNPILYVIIRACFVLEAIGICAVSWLIAIVMKRVMRAKSDEEYFTVFAKNQKNSGGSDLEAQSPENRRGAMTKAKSQYSHSFYDLSSAMGHSGKYFDDDDSDEDDDLPNEREATPIGKKSMRDILFGIPVDENLNGAVNKMKSALVQSARLSAVVSTRDIDMLMSDLAVKQHQVNKDSDDSDDSDSDDDSDDDLRGDHKKKDDTPLAKKSLRDFSTFLTTKHVNDDNEDEDVDNDDNNTSLAKKSMRDIIGAIFNSKYDDANGNGEDINDIFFAAASSASSNDDDSDDDDLRGEAKEETTTPHGKKSMRDIIGSIFSSSSTKHSDTNHDDDDDDALTPSTKKETSLERRMMIAIVETKDIDNIKLAAASSASSNDDDETDEFVENSDDYDDNGRSFMDSTEGTSTTISNDDEESSVEDQEDDNDLETSL